jgi:hypothetical protein
METITAIKKNPIIFQSEKQKRLEEAKEMFLLSLSEFAKSRNLSDKDYKLILKSLEEAFLEKKASYMLEDQIRELSNHLNFAIRFALSGALKNEALKDNFTKVFYYRNKKSAFTYERFR